MNTAKDFLQNKQNRYFEKYGEYGPEEVIAEWMEEYHQEKVLNETFNKAIEEVTKDRESQLKMLQIAWFKYVDLILKANIDNNLGPNAYDAVNHANDVIRGYASLFEIDFGIGNIDNFRIILDAPPVYDPNSGVNRGPY